MKMKARPGVSVPSKHSPLLVGFVAVMVLVVASLFVYVGAFVLQRMPRRTDKPNTVSAHVSPVTTSSLATLDTVPTMTTPGSDSITSEPDNKSDSSSSASDLEAISNETAQEQEVATQSKNPTSDKPQPKPTKKRSTRQSFIETVEKRLGFKRKQPNSQM